MPDVKVNKWGAGALESLQYDALPTKNDPLKSKQRTKREVYGKSQ